MNSIREIKKELLKHKNPRKAEELARFFKTKRGEYGYGDKFLGIVVPIQRKIAKKYPDLMLDELQELILSKYHEFRLTALLVLINKYNKATIFNKRLAVEFYLGNTRFINNWDLVDLSASQILGDFLLDMKRDVLYELIKSKSLWDRRIAIIATFAFIRNNQFEDTLRLAEISLHDTHDLMHKAVGWMLREVGKRDMAAEEAFLMKNCKKMPRTMLRYAIEKFPEDKREFYLNQ
ncbi:MAG: DNA alkylation repair protein [Candidatus Woesearchaeota archaeon]